MGDEVIIEQNGVELSNVEEGPTGKEKIDIEEDESADDRPAWDNKIQYLLSQIGFAVGLGNVWRFPYLCQRNGGGAFLIPYLIMLVIEGIPIFHLELAIGQRIRKGSIDVWNQINPLLGGVGVAMVAVSFLVALYYNVIIGWCAFYFFNSFQAPLPWATCPGNGTVLECEKSSPTAYFWYREALDTSESIEDGGGINWKMMLCIFTAWLIVCVCMIKGIKSSGKAIYFTATFPYVVLLIFFFRGVTLEGAGDGLAFLFIPRVEKLADPIVWLEAATQIFFSLSVAFGGLISFSSYNPRKNNCTRDAVVVAIINSGTSIFASIVIFSVLGFKALTDSRKCLQEFQVVMDNNVPDFASQNMTVTASNYMDLWGTYNTTDTAVRDFNFGYCSKEGNLNNAVGGTGLAFVVFTEAMNQFYPLEMGPFWSILFFLMLANLGLSSMFGTLEGVITPLRDAGIWKWRKEFLVVLLCVVCFLIGLIFAQYSGSYWLDIFNDYSGTFPLLIIAFFENIAIVYVYGLNRLSDDLLYMTGSRPNIYWKVTWMFLTPVSMLVIFGATIYTEATRTITYKGWDSALGQVVDKGPYPWWGEMMCYVLICLPTLFIPLVFVLRLTGLMPYRGETLKAKQKRTVPGAISKQNLVTDSLKMRFSDLKAHSTEDSDSVKAMLP
ncbi:SLC6A19 [Branchiostoma lanceolatum]|uniref:Transporter n=1 Tax=Branchiostoma lanceolatum TaxID=7740 RepID=A0A8J9ZBI3_BRALA|nr:SLC6A19 [Branchiostoma lanceolatum]